MNRYALSVSRYLIPAFMTACWATASLAQSGPPGGIGVTILNNPLPVFVMNPPNQGTNSFIVNPGDIGAAVGRALGVGTPVTIPLTFDFKNLTPTAQYTVPTGQRLIIHTVSGNCKANLANVNNLAIGVLKVGASPVATIWLLDMPLTSDNQNTGSATPVFNVLADASFDAGTQLSTVGGGSSSGPSAFLQCQMNAFGQLVNTP